MDYCTTEPISTSTAEVWLDGAELLDPEPHTAYHVEAVVLSTSTEPASGTRVRVEGAGAIGGCIGIARSTAGTSFAMYAGAMYPGLGTASVLGSSQVSVTGWTPTTYECWMVTGESPGPIGVYMQSENANTVTAVEGVTCLDVLDSAPVALPSPHPAAPTTLLFLGHSILNGNGTDPTYGGGAIPAWVTYRKQGSTLTAWPSAPALVPYVVEHLDPVAGATIVTRAAGGATWAQVFSTHWPAAVSDWTSIGATPQRVVVWAGENNCGSQANADALSASAATDLATISATYPDAVIDVVLPATPLTEPYVSQVRSALTAAVALDPTHRVLVDPRAPAWVPMQTDRVHLQPGRFGGNDVMADRLTEGW